MESNPKNTMIVSVDAVNSNKKLSSRHFLGKNKFSKWNRTSPRYSSGNVEFGSSGGLN